MQLLREVKEFRANYNRVFNLCKLITGIDKEQKKIFQESGKVVDFKGTACYRFLNNPEKLKKLQGQLGKFVRESLKVQSLLSDDYSDELFEEIKSNRRLTLLLVFGYAYNNKKHYNLFPVISFFRGLEPRELLTGYEWSDVIYEGSEQGNRLAELIVSNEEKGDALEDVARFDRKYLYDDVVDFIESTIQSGWDKSKLEPEEKPLTLQEALAKISKLEAKIAKLELELKSKQ